jgi:hypothetical protein
MLLAGLAPLKRGCPKSAVALEQGGMVLMQRGASLVCLTRMLGGLPAGLPFIDRHDLPLPPLRVRNAQGAERLRSA